MKRALPALLALSITLRAAPALCEDAPTVAPLKKDEPAPYTGLLLNPAAAAGVMSDKRIQQDVIKAEVDRAVGAVTAQLTMKLKESETSCREKAALSQADLKLRDASIAALEDDVKKAQSATKWTPIWVATGAAGGVAATLLGIFVYSKATK